MPAPAPSPAQSLQQSQPQPAPRPAWRPTSKSDQDEVNAIHQDIERIFKIVPPNPYILTIPCDVEPRYHHASRNYQHQWLHNTPFAESDHESLQYLTFVFHEPGKSNFVQHAIRPEDIGADTKAKPATLTPTVEPKRTITLDAYKKKLKGELVGNANGVKEKDAMNTAPAVKGPVEQVKAEMGEKEARVMGPEAPCNERNREVLSHKTTDSVEKREDAAEKKEHPNGDIDEAPVKQPSKRKREDSEVDKDDKKADGPIVKSQKQDNAPESKKQRTTSITQNQDASQLPPSLSSMLNSDTSFALPSKLSPLERPESSKWRLPPRLSPTIPSNIARSLQARSQFQSTPRPSNPSAPDPALKEERLTPAKSNEVIAKRKSPVPLNGFRTGSSSPAIRSDVEDKIRPASSIPPNLNPKGTKDSYDDIDTTRQLARAGKVAKRIETEKRELIVKLKYKKSQKDTIKQILRMRPSPSKDSIHDAATHQELGDAKVKAASKTAEVHDEDKKSRTPSTKGLAQRLGPTKKPKKLAKPDDSVPPTMRSVSAVGKKRALPDEVKEEGTPPTKQQKPNSIASAKDKLELPDGNKLEPPLKRQKAVSADVKKRPSTPAQLETQSPASFTSAQKLQNQSTPGARKDLRAVAMNRDLSQDSNTTPTPSTLPDTPKPGNASLQNGVVKMQLNQQGKTAKQTAWEGEQSRLQNLGRELKHAATAHAKAMEGSQSKTSTEHKLAAAKAVESFLCYLLAFTCGDEADAASEPRQSPTWRRWRSLAAFYGFVKLHSEPFAPLWGLACCLGVVFNAHILKIITGLTTADVSRDSVLELEKAMQRAATDSEKKLDLDALQDNFPRSWQRRIKGPPIQEKLEPGKMAGTYKLPIGITTSPVGAARAGLAILQEWMEQQKLDYTMKLKL